MEVDNDYNKISNFETAKQDLETDGNDTEEDEEQDQNLSGAGDVACDGRTDEDAMPVQPEAFLESGGEEHQKVAEQFRLAREFIHQLDRGDPLPSTDLLTLTKNLGAENIDMFDTVDEEFKHLFARAYDDSLNFRILKCVQTIEKHLKKTGVNYHYVIPALTLLLNLDIPANVLMEFAQLEKLLFNLRAFIGPESLLNKPPETCEDYLEIIKASKIRSLAELIVDKIRTVSGIATHHSLFQFVDTEANEEDVGNKVERENKAESDDVEEEEEEMVVEEVEDER